MCNLILPLYYYDPATLYIYFSQVSIDIDVPRDFESLFISYVDGKKHGRETPITHQVGRRRQK